MAFTDNDVKTVQDFLDAMEIKTSQPVTISTNNAQNDTINMGDFDIIQDENGKFQVSRISVHYSREHGNEQDETPIGEYFTLEFALGDIGEAVFQEKVQVYWERKHSSFFENSSSM